jgi:hypothetical protein
MQESASEKKTDAWRAKEIVKSDYVESKKSETKKKRRRPKESDFERKTVSVSSCANSKKIMKEYDKKSKIDRTKNENGNEIWNILLKRRRKAMH